MGRERPRLLAVFDVYYACAHVDHHAHILVDCATCCLHAGHSHSSLTIGSDSVLVPSLPPRRRALLLVVFAGSVRLYFLTLRSDKCVCGRSHSVVTHHTRSPHTPQMTLAQNAPIHIHSLCHCCFAAVHACALCMLALCVWAFAGCMRMFQCVQTSR
jgi:hypothetical protein